MPMSKGRERRTIKISCATCGRVVYAARPWAAYCSVECRLVGWGKSKIEKRGKNEEHRG